MLKIWKLKLSLRMWKHFFRWYKYLVCSFCPPKSSLWQGRPPQKYPMFPSLANMHMSDTHGVLFVPKHTKIWPSSSQGMKVENGLNCIRNTKILDRQYYLWFLATQLGMRPRPMWNSSHILWSGIFASTSGQWSLPLVILTVTERRTHHLWQKHCIPKQEVAYLWNSTKHVSIVLPHLQIEIEPACGQNFYFW